jgi:hypothetical protein
VHDGYFQTIKAMPSPPEDTAYREVGPLLYGSSAASGSLENYFTPQSTSSYEGYTTPPPIFYGDTQAPKVRKKSVWSSKTYERA